MSPGSFYLSLIHSVAPFPPVNASFLFSVTEKRLGERKKKAERKKSRSASLFPPPLLPQLFTVNLRENKRSVSPVHSSALLFHPLTSLHSHIRFIPPFSQGYMCAHERRRPKVKSALLITVPGLVELQNEALQEENYSLSV